MKVLRLAYRLLSEYEASGRYVNLLLGTGAVSRLSAEEKARLTALLYTTVERKLTYDYYISALAKRPITEISETARNILRLGLCQLCDMDTIPDYAAVNETVKLAVGPAERAFVNGVLRAAARNKGALPLPDKSKNLQRYLSVVYSYPLWMVKRLFRSFGEQTEALLRAMNTRAPLMLAVNTLKISREEYIKMLAEHGIEAIATESSPLGVRICDSMNPKSLPGFDTGLFYVQDEASQIAALALGTEAGDTVIDVCAAPGGKSITSAILSGDSGKIYSFDVHEGKLPLIEENVSRLSLRSVSVDLCDALEPKSELFGRADRLICDVPCSGLGVISKKPDLRYKSEESIEKLPALSLEILEKSLSYLKVGGTAVFSTCTILDEENGDVFRELLARHGELSAEDFAVGKHKSRDGMLTLLPHIDGTDGFFIAKMRKNK